MMPEDICPACGVADPDVVTVDFGIGAYEYWGAVGYHTDEHVVTRCCEAVPEMFLTEPEPAIYEYEVV